MTVNHVSNIAVVGAAGRSGGVMVNALLGTGKHRITAITRPDSNNVMPTGIHDIKKADYDDHASLVSALTGQDVLIITMNVLAPQDSQFKLIDAAVDAGVRYILPNEWGVDQMDSEAGKDTFMGGRQVAVREHIKQKGGEKTGYIGVCCGFWYEFSLAGTDARYGFDFDKKTVTLYDEGTTRINTSTFHLLGEAVAKLLSLEIAPDGQSGNGPYLDEFRNGVVNISSFFASQKDMFEAVLRVTGDKESDWTISYEPAKERYQRGLKIMQQGQMVGFGILLYARMFYKDGAGDFNAKLQNDRLGLPQESFDAATKLAVEMAARGETNAIG